VSGLGVRQVVVLGAGWDTRAYGWLAEANIRTFEADTPPTQRVKTTALERAGIDATHVRFVETDFGQRSWLDALQEHGFDPALPSYILWEGVTMYLEEDAVRSTLASLENLAPGSRIAFDYLSRELVDGAPPFGPIGKLMASSVKLYYGELFRFGISTWPTASDRLAAFFGGAQLVIAEHDRFGTKPAPWGGVVLVRRD